MNLLNMADVMENGVFSTRKRSHTDSADNNEHDSRPRSKRQSPTSSTGTHFVRFPVFLWYK